MVRLAGYGLLLNAPFKPKDAYRRSEALVYIFLYDVFRSL